MMRRVILAVLCALSLTIVPHVSLADSRVVVYPGQVPLSEQTNLNVRFARLARGTNLRDFFGSNIGAGVYSNLSVVPNGGMYVTVQPTNPNTLGSVYMIGADDPNPVPNGVTPNLPADPTQILIWAAQQGSSGSIGPLTAPANGLQQYYIVEAQIQTVPANPQNVQFVNSAGATSYQNVNTQLVDALVYQLKPGVPSSTPQLPTVDSGWIPIANILVPGGASSITQSMITPYPAFNGFVINGSNVTISGLTLRGAPAGCLQTNSSGTVSVQPCTSGLGTVSSTFPITASTSNGIATVGCPTCVTSVSGSGAISSSGGTTPTISLQTPLSVANGGTGLSSATTGCLGYSGTSYGHGNCVDTVNGTAPITASQSGTTATIGLSTPLGVAYGGTGLSSATTGCLGYSGTAYGHNNCLDTAGTGLSASGTTVSVATNGITPSLMAQAPANTLLGNNTGSSANVAYLNPAQVGAMMCPPSFWALITPGAFTYTTPTCYGQLPLYLDVQIVGGGGGGAGASGSTSQGNTPGQNGGATTFGSAMVGGGGGGTSSNVGPTGTACTSLSGIPSGFGLYGSSGQPGAPVVSVGYFPPGGAGGATPFGGGGAGGGIGKTDGTGSGDWGAGGGGGTTSSPVGNYSGAGGGSGCYAHFLIFSPTSSYSGTIGAGGSGGTGVSGGSSGSYGQNGAAIVIAHWQ